MLASLATLAIVGQAALWAVRMAPAAMRMPVAWGGAAVTLMLGAAGAVAVYYAQSANCFRERMGLLDASTGRLTREVAELADEILPAVAQSVRAGLPVQAALAAARQPADVNVQRVLQAVAREIGVAERRGAAAMAVSASTAARIQSQTTRMLADLRELEDRYSEQDVFAGLLDLDHQVSQLDRLADSIALLSGGRSGRRWTRPIVMESIVRGALGRISAYRRIRLHSVSNLAVAGHAAEGVMHTLAELMDNATSFSAQGTEVHVYVEEEDTCVVVTIEDSGLGMRKRERRRAEELVAEAPDLRSVPGSRLGLASVGRLAGKYGFTVNFRPSSRGGTGVVVMIPRELLTQPWPEAGTVTVVAPVASGPAAAGSPLSAELPMESAQAMTAPRALPKRVPGQTLSASRLVPEPEPGRQPDNPGTRFAAFRAASDRNRLQGAGPENAGLENAGLQGAGEATD